MSSTAKTDGEQPEEATGGAADPSLGGRSAELARKAREQREAEQGDVIVVDDESLEARDAAAEDKATEADWDSVTEWLLADTAEVITRRLDIRVGGSDKEPRMMPWIIKAIPTDVIRRAEAEGAGENRAQRRGSASAKKYDDLKANLRVVVEGTVKPDLKTIAVQQGVADPTILLQKRLAFRPGIIARLAGEIMGLSGFDEADVRAAEN